MPTEEEKTVFRANLKIAAGLCKDYEKGTLPFDDTFSRLETILGLEPNSFEREKIRRSVEEQSVGVAELFLIEFLGYFNRTLASRNDIHRSHIEQGTSTVTKGKETSSLLGGALAFYEYVAEKSPEIAEALTPLLSQYTNEVMGQFREQATENREVAERNANRIKADSFEGASEFTPNTVEELLGDIDKK